MAAAAERASAKIVVDSENLRQTALKASWHRDRSVGRRRVWARWALWWLKRWLLRLAVVVVVLTLPVYGIWRSGYGAAYWVAYWAAHSPKPTEVSPAKPTDSKPIDAPPPEERAPGIKLQIDKHLKVGLTALPTTPLKPDNPLKTMEPTP